MGKNGRGKWARPLSLYVAITKRKGLQSQIKTVKAASLPKARTKFHRIKGVRILSIGKIAKDGHVIPYK